MIELREHCVYRLKSGDLAVFKWWGQTGKPVFHPLGEPSFQDVFILNNWQENVVSFVRVATRDDLGICDDEVDVYAGTNDDE